MKKNGNSILQTLDRLIYDGTSRSGRTTDDSIGLFIDKLFQRTMKDHSDILHEISKRQIKWLVHFTPASNVQGILKYGLIPRNYLEKKPLCEIIKSVFPDDKRIDGMRESNCISVSFPNYQLFYLKRRQLGSHWAVIMIDPEILSYCPCIFFNDNAARCITRDQPHQSFGVLFEDVLVDALPESLRTYLQLPHDYTTNPQAEILLNSMIPPKFIRGAYFEKPEIVFIEMKDEIKYREKIWASKKYFRPRHDFYYWSKEKEKNVDYPDDWVSIRETVMHSDGDRCGNCGKSDQLQMHHIVPLSKGGTNNLGNLRTLCKECHEKLHPHMRA